MKLTDDVRVEESAALNEIRGVVTTFENRIGTCQTDFQRLKIVHGPFVDVDVVAMLIFWFSPILVTVIVADFQHLTMNDR